MLGWQVLEGVYMIQGEVIRVIAGVVGQGVEEVEEKYGRIGYQEASISPDEV